MWTSYFPLYYDTVKSCEWFCLVCYLRLLNANGYFLGHLMLNRMASLTSFVWSLRDAFYIKSSDFCFLFNVMFFLVLWVYMLHVDSSVQCRWQYYLFGGYFERFRLMTVLVVFSLCMMPLIIENTFWQGIHCVTAEVGVFFVYAEISEVGIWNIFCLLCTLSGCFLVLLNWSILQKLLYANQVLLYCMFSQVIGIRTCFFWYGAACNFPVYGLLIHSHGIMFLYPYFCWYCGSSAQVRFDLSLKCIYFRFGFQFPQFFSILFLKRVDAVKINVISSHRSSKIWFCVDH